MKKNNLLKIAAVAAGLAIGSSAFGGDIYDILPCTMTGVVTNYASSVESPLPVGKELYFKLRLAPRVSGERAFKAWRLAHRGSGSIAIDRYSLPKIGIYTSSGDLTYATMLPFEEGGSREDIDGTGCSEFIFKYKVRQGDFALPIIAATSNGKRFDEEGSGAELYVDSPYAWHFVNTSVDTATGAALGDFDTCSFARADDSPFLPSWPDGVSRGGANHSADISLAETCNFNVRSISFANWTPATAETWCRIHAGSTDPADDSPTPAVVSLCGTFTNLVTFYAWSEDDSIVRIAGGSHVAVSDRPITTYNTAGDKVTETHQVATIQIPGGGSYDGSTLVLYGSGSEGQSAKIYLSPTRDFVYNPESQYALVTNFITATVTLAEPQPTRVRATLDKSTLIATGDYLIPAGTLSVAMTEAYPNQVSVTVTPTFTSPDDADGDWRDYLRFATGDELNPDGTLPLVSANDDAVPPVVTLQANSTDAVKLYVFALRGDGRTNRAGHQIKFDLSAAEAEFPDQRFSSVPCYIYAAQPTVTAPQEGATLSATAGEDQTLNIVLFDTYADLTSKDGYTITWTYDASNSATETELDGKYVVGTGNVLYKRGDDGRPTTEKPIIHYNGSGAFTALLKVKSPVSGLESDGIPLNVNVAAQKEITLSLRDSETGEEASTFYESDEAWADVTITLSAKNTTGKSLYAYLLPSTEVNPDIFDSEIPFIVGQDYPEGLEIPDGSDTVASWISFLDGAAKAGTKISFSVVLSAEKHWDGQDANKIVKGYDNTKNGTKKVTIKNVEPVVEWMEMGGIADDENEDGTKYFKGILPLGSEKTFTAIVNDPGWYDLDNTHIETEVDAGGIVHTNRDDRFYAKWIVYCDGMRMGDPVITRGNPALEENGFTYTFSTAAANGSDYRIDCFVRDKDMANFSKNPSYSATVRVMNKPHVVMSDLGELTETIRPHELDRLKIHLDYFDSLYGGDIWVALKVKSKASAENPGRLKFSEDKLWKNVLPDVDPYDINADGSHKESDPDADYYLFKKTRNSFEADEVLQITDIDGVYDSFELTAYVAGGTSTEADGTTESVLPTSGILAGAYYEPATTSVYIYNAAPVVIVNPEENEQTNRWEVAGGKSTSRSITWRIRSDVAGDFETEWPEGVGPGVHVVITVNGVSQYDEYVTNADGHTFNPDFGSLQGDVDVVLTVEDKDHDPQTWTWFYTVTPSKLLETLANGPSSGHASAYSSHYSNAPGRGAGHLFVVGDGITFTSSRIFRQQWNCGKNSRATVYGFGYRYDSPIDNGWLDPQPFDQAIDEDGNAKDKAENQTDADGFYDYRRFAFPITGELDSFAYGFIVGAPQTESARPEETFDYRIETRRVASPSTDAYLPTELTKDNTYIPVLVEGVFSLEWRPADNLGDINYDGIPDFWAIEYPWQGGRLLGVVTESDPEGYWTVDTRNIANANPDGERLPQAFSVPADQYPSYAPIGNAFDNLLEMRGFHTGLNETDASVATSDNDFSDVETAAANASGNPATWSPEPGAAVNLMGAAANIPGGTTTTYAHMDPTVVDTDGDTFEDGWEYFFWYMAHVWAPGADGRANPRAGQFRLFERFDIDNPLRGTEIPRAEVEVRFNPCWRLDTTPNDFNPDFDRDGLSDLEEMVLGTNPCHWDTDGDHLPDSWEVMMLLDPLSPTFNTNPDNDFMAFFRTWGHLVWRDPDSTEEEEPAMQPGARYYCIDDGELEENEDFDPDDMVMLRDRTVRGFVFEPKYDGDDVMIYGRAGGDDSVPLPPVAQSLGWGSVMVDSVARVVDIELHTGDVLDARTDFLLIHDQVRDAFGFDPRTGWNMNVDGFVADRWDPSINTSLSPRDTAGRAVNTRPYFTYDEYLVMIYRMKYGILYGRRSNTDPDPNITTGNPWVWIRAKTTNPSVSSNQVAANDGGDENADGGEEAENANANTQTREGALAETVNAAFNQIGSAKTVVTTHGADTDQDGVPDGWELYTRRNPNVAPDSRDEDGLGAPGALDFDADGLSYIHEYAGTDSCNAYPNNPEIIANHPQTLAGEGNPAWFNKFFPTDPGSMRTTSFPFIEELNRRVFGEQDFLGTGNEDGADTDADGLMDGEEGGGWSETFYNGGTSYTPLPGAITFLYDNPTDDGLTCCIRGAGMNPCSIDTDLDGLPDLWEHDHAGMRASTLTRAILPNLGADLDAATFVADGLVGEAPAGAEERIYIAGGLDATYGRDAVTDWAETAIDPFTGTIRDYDFDHDGLQNYQEYLVQTIRHFRWDDITTPLMGRMLTEGIYDMGTFQRVTEHTQTFKGYVIFDAADPAGLADAARQAWGEEEGDGGTVDVYVAGGTPLMDPEANRPDEDDTFVCRAAWSEEGWRMLGYFAPPVHAWDRAFTAAVIPDPLYLNPIGSPLGSTDHFVSTDPRMADTDGDGMDDHWELFHGLNPILGTTPDAPEDSNYDDNKHGDIISAAYGQMQFFNGYYNEWIYPTYGGLMPRMARGPDVGLPPIGAPQCFDPVLYPWLMGSAVVDADGDGLRNDAERVLANVTDPMHHHTDPTPLWFTERTTPASYVAQYYLLSRRGMQQPWAPASPIIYSIEEGEGYDTDNDWTPDSREVTTTTMTATDANRFDDPYRRQALYLDGVESYALTRTPFTRANVDLLKQFTAECWVRPEETGRAQTILDRSVVVSANAITKDAAAIRSNFRIGLDPAGVVYGMFDNDDAKESGLDQPISCQRVDGLVLPVNKWSHVALTFNGTELAIYVNGEFIRSETTQLIPANGIHDIQPAIGGGAGANDPSAVFVGARPKKLPTRTLMEASLSIHMADPETGLPLESFDNLREYFKGYVDEIRVWDGARTGAEILADYGRRYTMTEVAANRDAVYAVWKPIRDANDQVIEASGTRNANDALRNLPAELIMHWNFQTLPGAVEAADVAKRPAGFEKYVIGAAESDYASNEQLNLEGLYVAQDMSIKGEPGGAVRGRLVVGWWDESAVRSTVYDDTRVVPWIENTFAHLPLYDGGCYDTFTLLPHVSMAYTRATTLGYSSFVYPNAAVPYSSLLLYTHPIPQAGDTADRNGRAGRLVEAFGNPYQDAADRLNFDQRTRYGTDGSSDLLPLGNAFAKTCPEMWDGAVADAWEYTGDDDDADGLPDWWEEYARHNYGADLDPAEAWNWDTMITYRGMLMPASKAYLIDLALGLQPDGTINPAFAANVDTTGSGIPDWWERIFGVEGSAAHADSDGDGLSNYAEYLVSFVLDSGVLFDPRNAHSQSPFEIDYFKRIGSIYVGEIFTDHDLMEDAWERARGYGYVSPYAWDALSDRDEDGWSAYAECRYNQSRGTIIAESVQHSLGDQTMKDFPVPTLRLRLRYNLSQDTSGGNEGGGGNGEEENQVENSLAPVIVQTYTGKALQEANVVADATYSVVPGEAVDRTLFLGAWRDGVVRGVLTPGHVQPGTVVLEARTADQRPLYTWECSICRDELNVVHENQTYGEWTEDYLKHNPQVENPEAQEQTEWQAILTGETVQTPADRELPLPLFRTVLGSDTRRARFVVEDTILGTVDIGFLDIVTGEYEIDLSILGKVRFPDTQGPLFSEPVLKSLVFRLAYSSQVPVLQSRILDLYLGEANRGYVREGANTVIAFYDLDGNGAYTPGEPLGYAEDVDVGWSQGTAEIELTDTSPIITRVALAAGAGGGGNDEEGNGGSVNSDRFILYGSEDGDYRSLQVGELSGGTYQRFRVVRTLINGVPATTFGISASDAVVDKWLDLAQRPFIFEGDVLGPNEFDLDWNGLARLLADSQSLEAANLNMTSVTYRIVLGNGTIDSAETNNLFSVATVRHFDDSTRRTPPVGVTPGNADSVVYGARPTFTWSMGENNSYTAFQLQILRNDVPVWDSGVRRAPPRNSAGNYEFTPDAYAGDLLEPDETYTWQVTMYNAKFQTPLWSAARSFRMNTQTESAGYGTINVCAKYYGPSLSAGIIRVEAYENPDFSGDPVARTYVDDTTDVADFDAPHEANATLVGLPAGTYYVRAFLDSPYGRAYAKDDWEPWGYACPRQADPGAPYKPSAVAITTDPALPHVVTVHLEDVDTNGNNIPDLWEGTANGGRFDNGATRLDKDLPGGFAVNSALVALTESGSSTGAGGAMGARIVNALSSPAIAAMVMGVESEEALAAMVEPKVVPDSVAITSVVLDGASRTVALTVEAGVESAVADSEAKLLYTFSFDGTKDVVCKVWRKDTLGGDWGDEPVCVKTVTIGREAATVTVDLGDDIDLSSGFFKVTLE